MSNGTIKWFSQKKGFGCIHNNSNGQEIYVHCSAIVGNGFDALDPGEAVSFDIISEDNGLKAINVWLTNY